jgi:hypothetical protein
LEIWLNGSKYLNDSNSLPKNSNRTGHGLVSGHKSKIPPRNEISPRCETCVRADEAVLTEAIVRLATQYGRYGYRRIRRLLLDEGWRVSVKRVYRIWRREG